MDDSSKLQGSKNIFKRILAWAGVIISVVGALILGLFVGSKSRRLDPGPTQSVKDRISDIETTDGRIESNISGVIDTERKLDDTITASQDIAKQSGTTIERAKQQLESIEATESRIERLLNGKTE